MTWGKQWTNMDELLRKVAFISMRLHRTIWCHGVQSQGPGLFAPITLYLDSPPAVMNVLCRSSKKSPYKGNKRVYANTLTPTRCLSPTKSFAKNRIFVFLFTSPRCFERLLVSILLSIAYLLKCTLHDHLIQIHLCSRGPIFHGLSIRGDIM